MLKNKKRVSFIALDAKEFNDPNAPLKWYELTRDKALNRVKTDQEAGILGIRLFIQRLYKSKAAIAEVAALAAAAKVNYKS